MIDDIDSTIGQIVSQTALGVMTARFADGSFYDLDVDDASNEAAAACANDALCREFGTEMKLGGPATPEQVHAAIMSRYFDRQLDRSMRSAIERTEAADFGLRNGRNESMFGHSGMTSEEANRAVFDASNGDGSPLLRVKEEYYFS